MSSLENARGIPKHSGQAKLPARQINCIYAFFFEPIRFSVPARKRAMFSLWAHTTVRPTSKHSTKATGLPQKKYSAKKGHAAAAAMDPTETYFVA